MSSRIPSLILTLGVAAGGRAFACSCVTTEFSGPDALRGYDAVLVGQVVRIDLVEQCVEIGVPTEPPSPPPPGSRSQSGWIEHVQVVAKRPKGCSYEREVTLRVYTSWKRVDTPFVKVRTGQGGGDCGFDFAVGDPYVVFATLENGGPFVDIGSPTVIESGQWQMIQELGTPMRRFEHEAGEETW